MAMSSAARAPKLWPAANRTRPFAEGQALTASTARANSLACCSANAPTSSSLFIGVAIIGESVVTTRYPWLATNSASTA